MKFKTKHTFAESAIWLGVAVLILIYGVVILQQSPHIPLLFSIAVIVLYGVTHKVSWSEIREGIIYNISESIEAILIICLIGVTVGTWMSSGTVPAIIYYGFQIFSPQYFLISVVILCSIMSLCTGSSWTTIGTIGVAFIGIGTGLKIPVRLTAGAIISGAYFGDKQSPVSDSTNFAASVAKTDLYEHVRSMLFTTGPAYIGSLILFGILGLKYSNKNSSAQQISIITEGIKSSFRISPILFLPLIIMIFLIIKKFPAIPTMMAASGMGLLFTVFYQGRSWKEGLSYMYSGYVGNTGVEAVDTLVTRGGLTTMTTTITLMLFSLSLAGAFQATGIINGILTKTQKLTCHIPGLVISTWVLTFLLSFFAADPYLAMIIPANVWGQCYDEQGLRRSVLSRTLEDGGTIICPMVPWGTNGIYCSATLGVAVSSYLPYYFLGLLTPAAMLFCALSGFGIKKIKGGTYDSSRE